MQVKFRSMFSENAWKKTTFRLEMLHAWVNFRECSLTLFYRHLKKKNLKNCLFFLKKRKNHSRTWIFARKIKNHPTCSCFEIEFPTSTFLQQVCQLLVCGNQNFFNIRMTKPGNQKLFWASKPYNHMEGQNLLYSLARERWYWFEKLTKLRPISSFSSFEIEFCKFWKHYFEAAG